ncbi:MAG: aminopeptidase P N-terminal domain-containing protein [bacterium]
MMKRIDNNCSVFFYPVFILLFLYLIPAPVHPQDSDLLPAAEFAHRRTVFLEQMPDSSIAIFQAAEVKTRSSDVTYEYHQDNNFYYLTGVTAPNTIFVLIKGGLKIEGNTVTEILFVPSKNPRGAMWDAAAISAEDQIMAGFQLVKTSDTFQDVLQTLLPGEKLLFYSLSNEFLYEPVSEQRIFVGRLAKKQLREKYPNLKVKSPNKIIYRQRQIKSPQELQLMQKAIDMTCEAQIEAMRSAKPGMYEYQIEAVIEFIFKKNGAEYAAFPTIVGSGPNSTILHYWQNRRQMQKGDLVVMDIGAEYHGYSADVTRTIPISGKFTKKQRELYSIVVQAQKEVIAAVKPGVPFSALNKIAKKVMADAGYGKYFIHGVSHFLGLDTHDVGPMKTLKPGMVLTVEPGIYIRESADINKAYWNIGIRIEDDILVTENGHKVLSTKAPREIDEIEKLMQKKTKLTVDFN